MLLLRAAGCTTRSAARPSAQSLDLLSRDQDLRYCGRNSKCNVAASTTEKVKEMSIDLTGSLLVLLFINFLKYV